MSQCNKNLSKSESLEHVQIAQITKEPIERLQKYNVNASPCQPPNWQSPPPEDYIMVTWKPGRGGEELTKEKK